MEAMFSQILLMLVFCTVGYGMCRWKVIRGDHAQILSKLLVDIFLPCAMFKSFALEMTPEKLWENMQLLLLGALSGVVTILLGMMNGRLLTKDKYEQHLFCYTTVVSNNGFVGTPLILALYGDAMLLKYLVFCFPLNFYTYLMAFPQLTRQKSSFKMFLNPAVVAMVAGAIVGLSGIPVPEVVRSGLQMGANCNGPISMLLTGVVIAQFPLKKLLSLKKAYIMTALRLVVLPLVLTLAVKTFFGAECAKIAFLLYAMPCGMNTIVFPKTVGENCMIGAAMVMISTLLCVLTIPLGMALLFG